MAYRLMVTILSLLFLQCTPSEASRSGDRLVQRLPTETQSQSPQAFETQLLALTNRERSRAGLASLRLSDPLNHAAQLHAVDMDTQNYFDHAGLDGSSPRDRATQAGYEGRYIGENIAAGSTSPEETMAQWMESEEHRENILSPNYTEIGLGYSSNGGGEYGHYWVQVFGRRE